MYQFLTGPYKDEPITDDMIKLLKTVTTMSTHKVKLQLCHSLILLDNSQHKVEAELYKVQHGWRNIICKISLDDANSAKLQKMQSIHEDILANVIILQHYLGKDTGIKMGPFLVEYPNPKTIKGYKYWEGKQWNYLE